MAQHLGTAPLVPVGTAPLGSLVGPAPAAGAGPPATPQEREKLTSDWLEFLQRPEVQAGLLQFGINALQPAAPGRGTLAHIGAAVAGGGEAVGRVRAGRRERVEERRKAGLEERRVAVGEEQVEVQRAQITTTESTAKADRDARVLISQNKIEAAGKVLEEEVRVRLKISENTKDGGILSVASNMLIQRDKGILAATLVGEAPQGLSTTGDLFELYKRLKRVAGGEEPFQEGDISDEDMVRLFLGTPEEQAAAERAVTRLPPTQQERIRSKVDLQRSLRREEREESEPVPTGEVSGGAPKTPRGLRGRLGELPAGIEKAAERRRRSKEARTKSRTEDVQAAVRFVKERMEGGMSRRQALDAVGKFAQEQGLDVSRTEVARALRR